MIGGFYGRPAGSAFFVPSVFRTAESINVLISLREMGFNLAERDEYAGEHDNN